MNTLFSYLYRDACNYKRFKEVVLSGQAVMNDLLPYLHDNEFFVPSEVGLDDLQDDPFTIHDHIWHEIDSISETLKKPTVKINAKLFIGAFKKSCLEDWNQYVVFLRKGLI